MGGDTPAKETKSKKGILGSQPRGNHNVFTRYQKDPNCEVCAKTHQDEPAVSAWTGLHLSTKFGNLITADHKFLNVDRARGFHELDSEFPDEDKGNIGLTRTLCGLTSLFSIFKPFFKPFFHHFSLFFHFFSFSLFFFF